MSKFQSLKYFFKSNKNTAGFIFGCWILINFLPFRTVVELTDSAGNTTNDLIRSDVGFEDVFLFLPQFFLLIPLLLLYYSKKKMGYLLSIIFSLLAFLPIAFIYFVISFNLEIDPPYHDHKAGLGFVFLCVLNFFLIISSIDFYTKAKETKENEDELIDQLIG